MFSYLGDLRKAIKKLHDLCERLPLNGRITLPDSYVKSRLVRAARQVPVYKPVIDRLLITPTDDWAQLTSEDLFHQLELSVRTNKLFMLLLMLLLVRMLLMMALGLTKLKHTQKKTKETDYQVYASNLLKESLAMLPSAHSSTQLSLQHLNKRV